MTPHVLSQLLTHDGQLINEPKPLGLPFIPPPPSFSRRIDLKRMIGPVVFLKCIMILTITNVFMGAYAFYDSLND